MTNLLGACLCLFLSPSLGFSAGIASGNIPTASLKTIPVLGAAPLPMSFRSDPVSAPAAASLGLYPSLVSAAPASLPVPPVSQPARAPHHLRYFFGEISRVKDPESVLGGGFDGSSPLPEAVVAAAVPELRSRVEGVLDGLLHREFLLTLDGSKPFSWVGMKDSSNYDVLAQAVDRGLLTNANIGWMAVPHRAKSIVVYNRRAIGGMLRRKAVRDFFKSHGFEPRSTDEMISMMGALVRTPLRTPAQHAVFGVCMGYPLSEVKAFIESLSQPEMKARARIYPLSDVPGYAFGTVIRFTEQGERACQSLRSRARAALRDHQSSRAAGNTNLEIFNRWDEMTRRGKAARRTPQDSNARRAR